MGRGSAKRCHVTSIRLVTMQHMYIDTWSPGDVLVSMRLASGGDTQPAHDPRDTSTDRIHHALLSMMAQKTMMHEFRDRMTVDAHST